MPGAAAGGAVADANRDVAVAEPAQALLGFGGELLDDLDGPDLPRELGENRRLVAQPGADLERRLAGLRVQKVGHERDDERLRDGLPETDRQRHVLVGERPQL